MRSLPSVGEKIRFTYRKINDLAGRHKAKRRREIVVESVKDLEKEPLELPAYFQDCGNAIGRLLVTGKDRGCSYSEAFFLDWERPVALQIHLRCGPGKRQLRPVGRVSRPRWLTRWKLRSDCESVLSAHVWRGGDPEDVVLLAVKPNAKDAEFPPETRRRSEAVKCLDLRDFATGKSPNADAFPRKGELVSFSYPTVLMTGTSWRKDWQQIGASLEPRFGRALSVEDARHVPWRINEFTSGPFANHGRWRMSYFDFSKSRAITVSLDALRLPFLQLGALTGHRSGRVGLQFPQSTRALRTAARVARRLEDEPQQRAGGENYGVYAVADPRR